MMPSDPPDEESAKVENFIRLLRREYLRLINIDEYIRVEQNQIRETVGDLKDRGYDPTSMNLYSPRADPYVHHAEFLLDTLLLRIELLRKTINLPPKPRAAMIISPQVNAMTIRVPDTNRFILGIDASLMTFCYALAKIFVTVTEIKFAGQSGQVALSIPKDNTQFRVTDGLSPAEWLARCLQRYAALRAPTIELPIPRDKDQGSFLALLTTGMETFIIGHEYGHIALGHFDEPVTRTVRVGDDLHVKMVNHPWDEESHADQYGLILASRAVLLNPLQEFFCNFLGGYLTLTMFNFMDRAVSILATGNEELLKVETHPPAEQRMAVYRSTALQIGISDSSFMYGTLDSIDSVFRLLWPAVRELLLSAHNKGVRPHHTWDTWRR